MKRTRLTNTLKICPTCGNHKQLLDFPINKTRSDGRSRYCTDCTENVPMDVYYSPVSTGSKSCSVCKQDKPLMEYYPCTKNKDGREVLCIVCHRSHDNLNKMTLAKSLVMGE